MSFEEVMGAVHRLAVATEALAATGAQLSLAGSGADVDAEIGSALRAVVEAAGLPDLDDLGPPQQAMLAGFVRTLFGQAADLLAEPARPPGWRHTDVAVLEGQGRASMMIPGLFASAAPELGTVTSFLDVGAGVGWLSVAAAQRWPEAVVVGIDIWEPSVDRAQVNVAESGLDDRVTVRHQDVTELDDTDAYDCAWVPSFFLSEAAIPVALAKVVAALRPGGWVVVGGYEFPPDPLVAATMALRTTRDGGTDLGVEATSGLLRDAGCDEVRPLEGAWSAPIGFVIGHKPNSSA
jgi:protein-L-isoaspartate O-methyltransferase